MKPNSAMSLLVLGVALTNAVDATISRAVDPKWGGHNGPHGDPSRLKPGQSTRPDNDLDPSVMRFPTSDEVRSVLEAPAEEGVSRLRALLENQCIDWYEVGGRKASHWGDEERKNPADIFYSHRRLDLLSMLLDYVDVNRIWVHVDVTLVGQIIREQKAEKDYGPALFELLMDKGVDPRKPVLAYVSIFPNMRDAIYDFDPPYYQDQTTVRNVLSILRPYAAKLDDAERALRVTIREYVHATMFCAPGTFEVLKETHYSYLKDWVDVWRRLDEGTTTAEDTRRLHTFLDDEQRTPSSDDRFGIDY